MKAEQLYDWIAEMGPKLTDFPMSRFEVFENRLIVKATDAEMRARVWVYGRYSD